ncbi:DUF2326 domain-containing protein [Elizabethkingia anophelis]|uniref:DUF2326 domain-containing protein n=1 Tax=Elizabethkingia anophelis TaxID=1117645 RepID=UPI00099B0E92|nr:DUF2326 domain-containing protein [Elizabethkingia anophelis]OPC33060.1 hypothetical protein BAX98_04255 [Elizabethkingia anophelis]
MLIEINCSFFTEKKISFSSGLNVILGDNLSSNSIGKSTLLMIIDFAFGGDSYLEKNSGAMKELGNHKFDFQFQFNGSAFFFSRATNTNNIIFECDKNYTQISEISIQEFREKLKKLYLLECELSFRNIVSPFSRVWGKENHNVDKPLQSYLKEPESDAVNNLIKLFQLYNSISDLNNEIKSKTEEKKAIDSIYKQNLVPKITKAEFVRNNIEIDNIKSSINNIKENLLKYAINIEELTNQEVIKLKIEKTELINEQSTIKNKIERIILNLNQKGVKSKYFKRIVDFIPTVNEEKILEIDNFHNKISTILNRELKISKTKLEEHLALYNDKISEIDLKINNLLINIENPTFIIDKLSDLTLREEKLKRINNFYIEKIHVTDNIKILNGKLDFSINDILINIENQINVELVKINEIIHSKNKKVPKIVIKRNSYNFDHSGDEGTGKSYSDLIEFDLSILKLTILPILIHDSPFFKNIGDIVMENIINLYCTFNKQIFIAIDGINRYSLKTQQILLFNQVIQLSDNNQLFIKDWRIKDNQNNE